METEIKVLDFGHLRLDDFMGGDLKVANSARVSFGRRVEKLEDGDRGIINFMLKHRHGTPFEHSVFTFAIKCPLFIAREWMRHRVGSFNELSMRYASVDPEFYVPDRDDVRERVGKPGHYTYERVEDDDLALGTRALIGRIYADAKGAYETMILTGIAPELARLVLPVGVYTEFYWTVNARSLMNFLNLRAAPEAQLEIRKYADACEYFFAQKMPWTYECFVRNRRVAP